MNDEQIFDKMYKVQTEMTGTPYLMFTADQDGRQLIISGTMDLNSVSFNVIVEAMMLRLQGGGRDLAGGTRN